MFNIKVCEKKPKRQKGEEKEKEGNWEFEKKKSKIEE